VSILNMLYQLRRNILDWCISSWSFCLRRLFPNKTCMLAMCNKQFYSFSFPLSNLFGIFRFELMERNFLDQVKSSWEKLTFPRPSTLRVQSRLQSYRSRPKHCAVHGKYSIAKEQPKNDLRASSKAILTRVTLGARGSHPTSMRIFWML
jgi:hypothetical protein